MPSGHVPADAPAHPELLAGLSCHIPVAEDLIRELRDILVEEVGPYERYLGWVSIEFAQAAQQVFQSINVPEIAFANAWDVFDAMAQVFDDSD